MKGVKEILDTSPLDAFRETKVAREYINKPMIRIANRFLQQSGFCVSDKILVEYQKGVVIIRKSLTANEHQEMVRAANISVLTQSGRMVPSSPSAVAMG